jgi:type II secretory pathway component PulC
MGDGTRLAIAILILFLAMVAFFFAFHPSGVANANGQPVNNPNEILQWLFGQWDTTVSGNTSTAGSNVAPALGESSGTGGFAPNG